MATKFHDRYMVIGIGTAGVADDFFTMLALPGGYSITPGSVFVYKGTSGPFYDEFDDPIWYDTTPTQVAHDDGAGLFVADGGALIDTGVSYIDYTTGAIRVKEAGAVFSATDYVFVKYNARAAMDTIEDDWVRITHKNLFWCQTLYKVPKTAPEFGTVLQNIGKHHLRFVDRKISSSAPTLAFRKSGALWPESLANDVSVRMLARADGADNLTQAIGYVYAWNANTSTYTNYTTAANNDTLNDVLLLPAATHTLNDAIYFGNATAFGALKIRQGTAGEGTFVLTWEYWNGSAWTTLPFKIQRFQNFRWLGTLTSTSTEEMFLKALIGAWTPPADWATTSVNGTTAYWIRARVSTLGVKTVNPLASRISIPQRVLNAPVLFARRDPALNTSNAVGMYCMFPTFTSGPGSGIRIFAGQVTPGAAQKGCFPWAADSSEDTALTFKPTVDDWVIAPGRWLGMRLDVFTEAPNVRVRGYILVDEDCDKFFDASPPWREIANFLHQGATYVNTPVSGITVSGGTLAPPILVGGLGFGVGIYRVGANMINNDTYVAAVMGKRV